MSRKEAKRRRLKEINQGIKDKINRLWLFGKKEDKAGQTTQIPASVIPELAEHLMGQEAFKPNDDSDLQEMESVSSAFLSLHKCELSYAEVHRVVTAALEAFNERDLNVTPSQLAKHINSLPGGSLWPSGVEGDQDET